jgi:hypothetical protein
VVADGRTGKTTKGSGLLRRLDQRLAPGGAGRLEPVGDRASRGRDDLDEGPAIAREAANLGGVADVEPGPKGVPVRPPDPLDLGLQLPPGGHTSSILIGPGMPPTGRAASDVGVRLGSRKRRPLVQAGIRDLAHPNRGVVGGQPILVGKHEVTSVTNFDGEDG